MTLADLLLDAGFSANAPSLPIKNLTDNAQKADEKSLLVCIRGARANGHDFAPQAYEKGCRAFVAAEPLTLPDDAFVLTVPDTREALARLADSFFGHPSRDLAVIGITGTKGKTTVASLLSQVLTKSGIPTGYVGTNGVRFGDTERALPNTTPDPITLQKTLCEMRDSGMRAVALEVSSQAVYHHRVTGIRFDTTLFTNLYSDHVGQSEHPSAAHYKACKHRLFTDFPSRVSIFNADDANAAEMMQGAVASRLLTYSASSPADYRAQNVTPTVKETGYGISFELADSGHSVSLPSLGRFNASNALAVLAVAHASFGLSVERIATALSDAHVTGRTETVALPQKAYAVIDYAHNGESLFQLLTALREYNPHRLICLFGSVGERSQLRRREMGDAAARLCDLAILTSDNPGREDPMTIIEEIARSFESTKTPYLAIPDRAFAIQTALRLVSEGDILVLAGKGHEDYQLIGTEKRPFSDREALLHAIEALPKACSFRT